jgi:uncharacterized membrane protein/protein-disulfide isomerase
LLLVLAVAGLGINLLLLFRRLFADTVVGCGGGGACDEMLVPPWSEVLGIPVTGLGALVYAALLISLLVSSRPLLTPLCGVLLGAAAWFLFVQSVLLGRYCPWCLAAHGIGVTLAVLGLWRQHRNDFTAPVAMTAGVVAIGAAAGIAFLQFFGPSSAQYGMTPDTAYAKNLAAASASGIYSLGDGRKVVLADGRRTYDLNAMPHLGPADAKFVLVEYFDYRCQSCRVMQEFLNALLAKHPTELCLIVLPLPLERSCNPLLAADDAEFPGSCKLTQLALAVWRTKPAAFADFHQLLLAGADVGEARSAAGELMPSQELSAALQDPWINGLIDANVRDWAALSTANKKLPKILLGNTGLIHGLPSGKAEFIAEIERIFGL